MDFSSNFEQKNAIFTQIHFFTFLTKRLQAVIIVLIRFPYSAHAQGCLHISA